MRLRHIEVFHAVYTTGSITNAAKLLHVSQPSVSKVLSHAELQLGFQLFDRMKGKLIATHEADLLFKEADRLYCQISSINDTAENIKNHQLGGISIGSTPALGFDIIPSAVATFKKRYPEICFNIQTLHHKQLLQHLLEHKSEVVVMFAPESFSGISTRHFGNGRLVAVFPKKLISDCPEQISLTELVKYPLISISDSGPLAGLFSQQMSALNISISNTINVQTYFIAASLVKYGAGVCIIDEFTARGQQNDDTVIIEISEQLIFPIKALYLENKPLSRSAMKFLDDVSDKINKQ